jgi:HNH endonuclease
VSRGPKVKLGTYVNHHGGMEHIRVCAGPQRDEYVHTLVMEAKLGRKLLPGETVDHENGNPLDNAWTNLVVKTNSENVRARHARRRATAAQEAAQ